MMESSEREVRMNAVPKTAQIRVGVMTSGGDAQGMNAAVRAVARTAMSQGAEVYAIFEGYQGMIDGGDGMRRLEWEDVGSVLHKGGTIIGTFRSKEFRERPGRLKAAANLLRAGIDRLVVIGGDGSLSGLDLFREEWPSLLNDLVATGEIDQDTADAHPQLMFAGLVGSIDNDLVGTDMTIGADSALHRIVAALDDLASTAASHHRCFVVEVMGRHCGYLALMSAIAGACDYVLVPENPPEDGWEQRMCAELRRGRSAGRRHSIVVIAEGATDRQQQPITAQYVADTITESLHEDTRVTILGHIQRGGTPSAYDRWASTWLGYEAANEVLAAQPGQTGPVIGLHGNAVARVPLIESVAATRRVPTLIAEGRYDEAMTLRGSSFAEEMVIFRELAEPSRVESTSDCSRVGILHVGGLAPGMNAAAWAAVRLGISRGLSMVGIRDGFPGLIEGRIDELGWSDVEGWAVDGGASLGLRRTVPTVESLYGISRQLETHRINALLVVGGWNAYQSAQLLHAERDRYPAFRIPIVCVPASIDNNLPGSQMAIGADTALNTIVQSIDAIKLSASATTRSFVVETMGRYCGFLALMGGLAGGAERVYLHEVPTHLSDLAADMSWLQRSFAAGRKLFLAVRNERASENYTTDFLAALLNEESQGRFDVRTQVIGHIQQGGTPSPFDRLLAVRLVSHALNDLRNQLASGSSDARMVGLVGGGVAASELSRMSNEVDSTFRRPQEQWWMQLRPVLAAVSDADLG